jgi:hypothetical protein
VDPQAILSSAIVAAVVSGLISYVQERQILDRKADVDYRSNARKRLYEAIGPLRLQLLFAARDVVDRVTGHLRDAVPAGRGWNMDVKAYYVQSFVYRILRPLAIGQLIERQMSIADFAVDDSALELLRFDQVAGRMLSGDEIVLGHEAADWSLQTDHLFRDNLRVAAASLMVHEAGQQARILDFAEFAERLGREGISPPLEDLFSIFGRCKRSLLENPIFWLRLVGYGYACNGLIASQGKDLGFRPRSYDGAEMLRQAADESIAAKPAKYVGAFDVVVHQGL